MRPYECDISVNGIRTKEIVYAQSSIDAKRLVELRYYGARITWWGGPR